MFIASGLLGHALVRVLRSSDLRETNHGVNPRLLPTFSFWAAVAASEVPVINKP
jgi:hypothetical protein